MFSHIFSIQLSFPESNECFSFAWKVVSFFCDVLLHKTSAIQNDQHVATQHERRAHDAVNVSSVTQEEQLQDEGKGNVQCSDESNHTCPLQLQRSGKECLTSYIKKKRAVFKTSS